MHKFFIGTSRGVKVLQFREKAVVIFLKVIVKVFSFLIVWNEILNTFTKKILNAQIVSIIKLAWDRLWASLPGSATGEQFPVAFLFPHL